MKNLLVVIVILTIFFSLFIYIGTHTTVFKGTPFYWVAKDMGELFSDIGKGIGDSVYSTAYPALKKFNLIKKY